MSKIAFLPQGYVAPKAAGNYLKLQAGETKIRILSRPVVGWLDFDADGHPVRTKYVMGVPAPKQMSPDKKVKHFWAFIIWNRTEERIQIYEVTQSTVQEALDSYINDEDWGDPSEYDIKISKSGEGLKTKYVVTAVKPEPIKEHVKEAFFEKKIWLEALFSGENPFDDWGITTPGLFEREDELPNPHVDMLELFMTCSEAFRSTIVAFLKQKKLKEDFSDLPDHFVDRIERAIAKDLASNKDMEEAL